MAIEKELGCKRIRINPDAENSDIFIEINKIQNHYYYYYYYYYYY